jgi:predicted transcriptional regulator
VAKKTRKSLSDLGRRERQIMEAVHRLGEAAVGDVLEGLPDPPSYSAVRTMMRHLESKGFLKHRRDGMRYVYRATRPLVQARRSALRHLVKTFFNDSATDAVAALLELSPEELTEGEVERLRRMIEDAREKGN